MIEITDGLMSFLDSHSTYILAGHKEPDGDCIGSCLAMDLFLKRRGKKTVLVSVGPFKRPEIKQYESLFSTSVNTAELPADTAVIVIDCSGIDRIGDAAKDIAGLPMIIIDHHATNNHSDDISLVVGTSPSTTVLIQAIIEHMAGSVTKEEANMLLFGLCTDTGFFRHLDSRSSETFSSTARLVEAGANPKKTFADMNGGKSFGSRILISRILSRMTRHYAGQLVISYENLEDTLEYGLEGRDSDTLYQLIQSITGVEAIVIVRQETEDNCTVGFRSLDKIDVSVVAANFGGGGHRQASGLSIPGKIADLLPRFIDAFAPQFPGLEP